MVEVLGLAEKHLLHSGGCTRYFFIEEKAVDGWRLMVESRVPLGHSWFYHLI